MIRKPAIAKHKNFKTVQHLVVPAVGARGE
jgi:hypothetical protein